MSPAARLDVRALVKAAQDGLAERADDNKAGPMQAYLKTEMPFYGVQKKPLSEVSRALKKAFVPKARRDYERGVKALWALPHREEKYLAILYARAFPSLITPSSLPLYKTLVVEGAWWDLVDDIAAHLVGKCLREQRDEVAPLMREWIDDDDEWVRRTAILSQLKHKDDTDADMLFDFCRSRMHEKSFWIRKAIGWALRQYSYTAPDAVKAFLLENKDALSGLSYREGAKVLVKQGLM